MSNLPVFQDDEPDNPYLFQEIQSLKRRKWLMAYAQTGMISGAAQLSGVNFSNHYHWLKDPVYAAAFARAKQIATDASEDEVIRRARHGIDEPVFYKGKRVDTVRKYSDLLLMFSLNGERPEKYHRKPDAFDATAPVTVNIVNYSTTKVETRPASEQLDPQRPVDAVKISKW